MDILDRLLQLAQISAGVNTQCHLNGHWRLNHPRQEGLAVVHWVQRGRLYLEFKEDNQRDASGWLEAGELVFFPRMRPHCLQSVEVWTEELSAGVPCETQKTGGLRVKRVDGKSDDGESCDLICLHFYYDPRSVLMEALPPFLRLSLADLNLDGLAELLKRETQSALGSATVVNGLALVWLTLIFRHYLQHQGDVAGVLKASFEPKLRGLLKAILNAPEADWKIEQMAEFIHVSRSSLVRLFQEHLGERPHGFVHRVRLSQAALRLRQSSESVLSVALGSGFQSETHFGKAFKKVYGMTPRQYRLQSAL